MYTCHGMYQVVYVVMYVKHVYTGNEGICEASCTEHTCTWYITEASTVSDTVLHDDVKKAFFYLLLL